MMMRNQQAQRGKAKPCPNGCGTEIFFESRFGDDGKLVTKDDGNTKWFMMEEISKNLHSCTKKGGFVKSSRPAAQTQTIVTEWAKAELDEKGEELKDGLRAFKNIAYHLAKEEHPELDDQTNLFGQIVNANTTHLINLALIKAIKSKGGSD